MKDISNEAERMSIFGKVNKVLGTRPIVLNKSKPECPLSESVADYLTKVSQCVLKPATAVEHLKVLSHFQDLSDASEHASAVVGNFNFQPKVESLSIIFSSSFVLLKYYHSSILLLN